MSGEYLGGSYLELTRQVVSQTVKILERCCLIKVRPAEGQEKAHPSQSAMILSETLLTTWLLSAQNTRSEAQFLMVESSLRTTYCLLVKTPEEASFNLVCLKSSHADRQVHKKQKHVAWYNHLWHQKKKNKTGCEWCPAAVSSRPQLEISQLLKCSFDTLCGKNKLSLPRRVF